ncbi:MAG: copper chaperone PCu(A)C [Gammaproteobacteria bacterium]|nr:copper chaperone PCu(A)C [Gammaproteobacteria bacterium]
MSRRINRYMLAIGFGLASASLVFAGDITVEDAWVRSGPPGASVLGGYLTIQNNSNKKVTLTSISSDIAENTEIHQTTQHNGMSRMQPINQLEIPSHGQLKFEPGGYHLMLIKPTHSLQPGDPVNFTLTFAGNLQHSVRATVRDATTEPAAHDMTQHHH